MAARVLHGTGCGEAPCQLPGLLGRNALVPEAVHVEGRHGDPAGALETPEAPGLLRHVARGKDHPGDAREVQEARAPQRDERGGQCGALREPEDRVEGALVAECPADVLGGLEDPRAPLVEPRALAFLKLARRFRKGEHHDVAQAPLETHAAFAEPGTI